MTQETPLEEIDKDEFIRIQVKLHLKKNPLTTYTIAGLMIQVFKIPESRINKAYSDIWDKEDAKLYKKIEAILEEMKANNEVNCIVKGKANRRNYWWNI